MCLRDPFRRKPQPGGAKRLPLLPKSKQRDKQGGVVGCCGVLVRDLLCGEALSPSCGSGATQMGILRRGDGEGAGAAALPPPATPKCRRLRLQRGSQMYPFHDPGSSFQSKIRDPSPHSCNQHGTLCRTTYVATTRRSHCSSGSAEAARASRRAAASAAPTATERELEEAMVVLRAREAKTHYRLSDRYIDALAGCAASSPPAGGAGARPLPNLGGARRSCVHFILKLVAALRLRTMIAAHAVEYLDRFLCHQTAAAASVDEFQLAAAACVRIAAKMDDTAAPSLASLRAFPGDVNEEKLGDMEAAVLRTLGWHMLAATASDFVATMLAHLALGGVPTHLLKTAGDRADELVQGILIEVEFLDYAPSVVSMCVMQCLLDEALPRQAASHMASLRTLLPVHDTLAAQRCYKTMVDLVADPLPTTCPAAPSPNRVLDV